jgi:hypothetical protein
MYRGMMPGQNQFLDQFMKMRRNIASAQTAAVPVKPANTIKGPMPTREMDLGMLCETKPKAKVVREYFERRVEELRE